MPRQSTAIIALGNSSSLKIRTTAQFSDGDSEDIEIPAGMTKFIRRRARQRDSDSVKLTTVGPEGSLRVMGFIVTDDNSFTSSIRFNDTKKIVQPNLYATNLRLKHAAPRIVLKNTGAVALSARQRFFTAKGELDNPVELPAMTLTPQQVIEVDLSALRAAAASRTDLDSVGVQIENSGSPGSLIGAAYSTQRATQLTYDVPLRDYGKVRNDTGSYPWRIDDDYSTVVSITNAGTRLARFQVEIRYAGGPYSIKPRQLEPGQTAVFDLRKMRDEQAPDRTGKALAVERGQFHWSVVATPGEAHLIGRAEVVSRSARVASSYSCPTCCPDSGPFGGFNPYSYTLAIDGSLTTSSSGDYYDCYWNSYPTGIWWSSLSTWDSGIATFATGTEDLHGEGVGSTYGIGDYDRTEWWTDNMDCYQYYHPAQDYANVDISDPDHVKVVPDDQGFPSNCSSTGLYVRRITVQIVNAYNEDVTTSASIKEDLTNISTNTCNNGSPQNWSCAPDDGGGRFTDQMAVSINFCGSGIPQNSGCGYTLTSNWSWCSGTPLSIWTYNGETRSNVVKVNGRTASYDGGRLLYGTGGPPVP